MMKVKKVPRVRGLGMHRPLLLVLPSEQPKNAISRAAQVSITVAMFDSKDKEKDYFQSPSTFQNKYFTSIKDSQGSVHFQPSPVFNDL
jgi:hypothetical protein